MKPCLVERQHPAPGSTGGCDVPSGGRRRTRSGGATAWQSTGERQLALAPGMAKLPLVSAMREDDFKTFLVLCNIV